MSDKVIFDFELNTSGSQRSIKEINDRIKQLTTELKKADIGSKVFNELNRELAKTRVEAKNISQDFKNLELEVQIDTADSDNSILGLQNRLKLLKDEIKGVEIGSEEFQRLEKEIANVNIEMKGVKEGLRGLDFGAVLGELGSALSGVAGAAGLISDALMDSDAAAEEFTANATRTIMIMQSLNGVAQGVDSAMKLLTVTLEKNPIMIWVAAAAALVGGLIALTKWLNSMNEETSSFNKLTEQQQALVKKTTLEYTRYRLELAQTNGNLKQQILLQEDIRKQEFADVVKEVADAFDLEEKTIRNATEAYTDYENNKERIKDLQNELKTQTETYVNATVEEKNAILASRRETNSKILALQNQNKEYEKAYKGIDNFRQINEKMSKEEAIFNNNKKKDYEETFKTILNDGRAAYEGLRDAYKSMVEELKGFEEDIAQSAADRRMRNIEQQIEDAKKLGDVETVIAKEKEKLQIEINSKIEQRKKLENDIVQAGINGQLAVREAYEKTVTSEKQLILLKKEQLNNQNRIVKLNDEIIKYNNEIIANLQKGVKEEDAINLRLKDRIAKNKEIIDDLSSQNEKIKGNADLQQDIIDRAKEEIALYKSQAAQLKTTELIQKNINELVNEIGDLQAQQARSQKEYINDAIRGIKEYSSAIIDEYLNRQLASYEKFLADSRDLLIMTEEDKNVKAFEITRLRLEMERQLLSSNLEDNLRQFELYIKNVDNRFKDNFDGMLEAITGDPEEALNLINSITVNISSQLREMSKTKATNEEDLALQKAKEELMLGQLTALAGLRALNSDIFKIAEKQNILKTEERNQLVEYGNELKRINDAQKAANEREIEQTLKIVSLGKEKMNALMAIEQMKLELYEGSIKKETEATKKQLLLRKDLEESAALELYEKKILTHEQYLEQIELIEDLYRKRRKEADRMAWKQSLEIAQVLYEGFFTTITNRQNDILNQRLFNIDTETDRAVKAEKEKADNNLITQAEYEREVEQIEYDANLEKRKLQREQAQRDRQYAVYQAIINTAVGVAKSIPNPFQMALAFATGAAQVAVAQTTPIPQFEYGGVIGGRRHNQGGTMVEAEEGEIILKRGVRSNPVLNNMASMINEAVGGNSFRLPMSSGTSGTSDKEMVQNIVTATVNGVKSIPVINVATETEKVNNKVTRLQNKAKL